MGNFLESAPDVTEEVGYSPKKESKTLKPSKNMMEEAEDLGEAPKGAGEDVDPSLFMQALNVLDIPGSMVRTGVEAAFNPERDVIPAVTEQARKTISSPTMAAEYAPTGVDINKQIFGVPEKTTPTLEAIGGITTEMALDPFSLFRPSKSVTKPIRKSLESASERQAAKAVSKYANRADVIKEGADLDVIGSRLVAEDLQGMLRKPTELYSKLAGKSHVQRNMPDSLATLDIRKSRKEGGMISEISKDITNAIGKVESEYGLAPQVPANIMMSQLLKNVKKNVSQISGESVDLDKVEATLESVLKPFEMVEIPKEINTETSLFKSLTGATPKAALKAGENKPQVRAFQTNISLTDLQQLRKNVGKQVADRVFYAAADANTKLETEVLRDLYTGLGDIIQKQMSGKQILIGNTLVDAGDYYKAQNNRLKSFLDLESMLEYTPTQQLKDPDLTASLASMAIKGGTYGGAGLAASLAGFPISPGGAVATGALIGAGQSAAEMAKKQAPEYLTSILKTAGKVSTTPYMPEAAGRGAIQYMREGKFVNEPTSQQPGYNFENVKPAFQFGRKPQSLDPMEVARMKLPRTTEGLIKNKEMVVSKLMVNGVPDEMIAAITQALNEDPDAVGSVAAMMAMQFPTLFEKSKYKMFDGKILDPQERAKAADDTSKREDLNSLQRAKIINEVNKTGKWLGE